MQDWSLQLNLEIVTVNGLTLWGNCHLIPRGPLREPLNALRRADVVVIHQADMVSEQNLKDIGLILREINKYVPVFVTQMNPSYFFDKGNANSRKSLGDLSNTIVLCVSSIGSVNAFAKGMEKIGAFYVDRLEFSDHHKFQAKLKLVFCLFFDLRFLSYAICLVLNDMNAQDIEMIKRRLIELEDRFSSKPVVIVTEKDYDRDPGIFKHLDPFEVLALCSELKIIPSRGCTEDSFKKLLKEVCT
ncbi:hypothetical protein M0R45_014822 [Rubus argutus]|uniref:tetraacyldisaccharide 4'-kinase n=1 Tax=Rubus argutus TaxID=59490 RepID=A0AAW1XNC6_RUBAR